MSFKLLVNGGDKSNPEAANLRVEYFRPKTLPSTRPTQYQRGYADRGLRLKFIIVLRRDRICKICEFRLSSVVDHKIAKSKGGTDAYSNLHGLCQRCHDIKTYLCDGGLGRPLQDYTDEIRLRIARLSLTGQEHSEDGTGLH
jgi:5-methylcytosine-specific restriction endonuclease McrA